MQRRKIAFTLCLGLAVMFFSSAALAQYQLTNLVSNQFAAAHHDDPLSVNAWGLTYGPGSPFWISDEGSGWSTLYSGKGVEHSLKVLIPSATKAGGPGSPTGIVFNAWSDFKLGGSPTFFLFATLDGTISGWPGTDPNNPNDASIAVNNNASGAVYTGLAITNRVSGNLLYAVDNAHGKIDAYDGGFKPAHLAGSFTDSAISAGFAPFGIQDINGLVYITFASTTGGSEGFVDVFTEDGTLANPSQTQPLVHGGPLNQPWGIAVAPGNFGKLSNTLLISNNTNAGTINAFNLATGQYEGTVRDMNGKDILIDQLWGIEFGGGTANNGRTNQLFFTAGPHSNLAGTFGVIGVK
jgi:uncharacterized protein (TIGR03118 family)